MSAEKLKRSKIMSVNLMLGDCLERMKEIPDGSVNMILTDPPYKITARGNSGNSGGMFQKKEVNNGKVFKTNDLEKQTPRYLPRETCAV